MAYEKNYWWNLSENIQGIKIHSRKDFKYYLRFPRPEINDIFSKNWYNVYLYVYCMNTFNEMHIWIVSSYMSDTSPWIRDYDHIETFVHHF